ESRTHAARNAAWALGRGRLLRIAMREGGGRLGVSCSGVLVGGRDEGGDPVVAYVRSASRGSGAYPTGGGNPRRGAGRVCRAPPARARAGSGAEVEHVGSTAIPGPLTKGG